MPRFFIRVLAAAIGFWIASRVIPGVRVGGVEALLIAGLLLGVINAVVRPILVVLTFPLTVLTLGLFLFVVNGITVWLVTKFDHHVQIHGFWHVILTAVVISLTSWLAGAVLGDGTKR
jgi:putative membrane protein